jgi:NADH-quinone oxidoreductase subunit E
MPHLTIELLLWMLLAFLTGCILGCILRKLFRAEEAPATKTAATGAAAAAAVAAVAAAPRPAPKPVATPAPAAPAAKPAAAPMPAVSTGKPSRPKGLAAARGGKGDDLQIISGVGPKLEKTLHGLGFFHFDQIAVWTRDQVMWVDDHLNFKGRIEREEWIPQCKLLAAGNMDEFNKKYGTGGQRKSGNRNRRSGKRK